MIERSSMSDISDAYINEGAGLMLDSLLQSPDWATRRLSGIGERKALHLLVCVGALWMACGLLGYFERAVPITRIIEVALHKNGPDQSSIIIVLIGLGASCALFSFVYWFFVKVAARQELAGFACALLVAAVLAMGFIQYFVAYVTWGVFLSIPISMLCSPLAKRTLQSWPDGVLLRLAGQYLATHGLIFGTLVLFGLDWRAAIVVILLETMYYKIYGQACVLYSSRLGASDPTGVLAASLTMTFPLAWAFVIASRTRSVRQFI